MNATAVCAGAVADMIGAETMDAPEQPATMHALCEVAARHDLLIVSDEIYRDLVYDTSAPSASPAGYAPERTVVTTALSKSLARRLAGGRRPPARRHRRAGPA